MVGVEPTSPMEVRILVPTHNRSATQPLQENNNMHVHTTNNLIDESSCLQTAFSHIEFILISLAMASAMAFRFVCEQCTGIFGFYNDYLQHCTLQHAQRTPSHCVSFKLSFTLCPLCASKVCESSGTDQNHQVTITLCEKCQVC